MSAAIDKRHMASTEEIQTFFSATGKRTRDQILHIILLVASTESRTNSGTTASFFVSVLFEFIAIRVFAAGGWFIPHDEKLLFC
jgi:hypothetical protein